MRGARQAPFYFYFSFITYYTRCIRTCTVAVSGPVKQRKSLCKCDGGFLPPFPSGFWLTAGRRGETTNFLPRPFKSSKRRFFTMTRCPPPEMRWRFLPVRRYFSSLRAHRAQIEIFIVYRRELCLSAAHVLGLSRGAYS